MQNKTFYTKLCLRCNKQFTTIFSKKKFCCNECKCKYWDKVNSDKKPRKTDKSYLVADELRKQPLSNDQYQIVLGTLMGDGCLIKSSKTELSNLYKVFWTHSEKQVDYLSWIKEQMFPFSVGKLIKYQRTDRVRKNGDPLIQYHLQTIGHDAFNRIHNILYRGTKKFVTRRYLNKLDLLGIATWYMDDGSYSIKNKSMVLCTNGFSLSENRTIQKWFWQKFKIECKISKTTKKETGKIYYYLRFCVKDTIKFQDLISKYMIPSMQYKLNPQRLIRQTLDNSEDRVSTY